ncbi:MAG: hypothetical protein LUG95_03865 [Clostridiales bacterium]|nr:hypothetical protein [Clostridiales bacterium]
MDWSDLISKIKITGDNCCAIINSNDSRLNSLVKNNTQYLWQGDSAYWSSQAPVCFPIVGV